MQIWPRFHQLDVVRQLLANAGEYGAGRRYLIQHSAGSGKSNSIAWLAHQLIGLAKDDTPVFDSIIVVTDRRRHAFLLHPVEGAGLTLMRLTVAAPTVPQPIAVAASPILPTARELIDARGQVKPMVRNSAYSVATGKDSEDIVPVMVFDDGTQTYFSFPNNRPIPAVFQIAPDGSEEMVNARMDTDDLLVADRVGRRFVLRLGQSVAAIINDAFDLDGVPPKDGTTVPGVARVVKPALSAHAAQAIHAAQPNRDTP